MATSSLAASTTASTTRVTNKMQRVHSPHSYEKTNLCCHCMYIFLPGLRYHPLTPVQSKQCEWPFITSLTAYWLGQDKPSNSRRCQPEPLFAYTAYSLWGKLTRSHAWARWKLMSGTRRVKARRCSVTADLPSGPEPTCAASVNPGHRPRNHHHVPSTPCVSRSLRVLLFTCLHPYLALGAPPQILSPVRAATPAQAHSPAAKRSYKRAVKRASRFGVTTYLGRTFTAKQLGVRYQPDNSGEGPPSPQMATKPHDLRVLYWNAGGLHVSRHAELKHWLHTRDEYTRPDLVIITETHWPTTMEYQAVDWHAVHTGAGQSQGGILVLIHHSICPAHDIRYTEIKPGRLLHVRLSLQKRPAVDVLAVYQHAWNPDGGDGDRQARISKLLANRSDIWDRVSKWTRSVPARNLLFITGDMNCPLQRETTHVGRGASTLPPGHHYKAQGPWLMCSKHLGQSWASFSHL